MPTGGNCAALNVEFVYLKFDRKTLFNNICFIFTVVINYY